jgi:transposase
LYGGRYTTAQPAPFIAVSALTSAGALRFSVFAGRFTAAVFIGFLRRLLRSTSGAVFLLLDGHPVHRSRKVTEWMSAPPRRLFFLPPYCPELNPTEYPNNSVKGGVPRFRWTHDKVELAKRVRLWRRVIQGRPYLARRFLEAERVRYAA